MISRPDPGGDVPEGPAGAAAAPDPEGLHRLVSTPRPTAVVALIALVSAMGWVAAAATVDLIRMGLTWPVAPLLPVLVFGALILRGGLPAVLPRLWRATALLLSGLLYAMTALTVGL